MEFDVKRCTRQCAASGRELSPGEEFFSVLLPDGAELRREDYSLDAWDGPPVGAVGCWRSRMPSATAKKFKLAPNEVMRGLLDELAGTPAAEEMRYVLALLLVRRRALQLIETEATLDAEWLVLAGKDEQEIKVKVAGPPPTRIEEIQHQLAQLLFADEDDG